MPQDISLFFTYDFTHAKIFNMEREIQQSLQSENMKEELESFFRKNLWVFREIHETLYSYDCENIDLSQNHIVFEGLHHYKLQSLNRNYCNRLEGLREEQRNARSKEEKKLIQEDIDKMNILTPNDMNAYAEMVKVILESRGYIVEHLLKTKESSGQKIITSSLIIRWT